MHYTISGIAVSILRSQRQKRHSLLVWNYSEELIIQNSLKVSGHKKLFFSLQNIAVKTALQQMN